MPLLQFSFPANVKLFCGTIAQSVQFNMLPTQDLTAAILRRTDDTDPEYDQEYPYNDNFDAMNYGSVNFIDTLAPMFYYQFVSLALTGLLGLAKVLLPSQKAEVERFQELEGGEAESETVNVTTASNRELRSERDPLRRTVI